jgi:hypothetical protein
LPPPPKGPSAMSRTIRPTSSAPPAASTQRLLIGGGRSGRSRWVAPRMSREGRTAGTYPASGRR